MQQRDVGRARALQCFGGGFDFIHRRHAGGKHDGLAGARASLKQRRHQQFIGRDLVEIHEGTQFRHRLQIEGRAGKLNSALKAALRKRLQMGKRQFPFAARAMLGALGKNFGGEHAVDLEELEFHRVAARIRRRIDESERARKIAGVIARCFGDENGGHRFVSLLTLSKEGMAKRWLTSGTVGNPMGERTEVFFIVSSGRSGTAMLTKALSAAGDIEMHHEYMVHIVQKLGALRYRGLASAEEATETLRQTHAAAIRYSEAAHWGDSSNKLSWLIPELAALLPDAKFVHLVRDGRKVAGSYFRKLADECYDDRSIAILQAHLDDPAANPAPPPEKKYWWPIPRDPRRIPPLRPVRAHRLALGGDQSRDPGFAGRTSACAETFRAAGGSSRFGARGALAFPIS